MKEKPLFYLNKKIKPCIYRRKIITYNFELGGGGKRQPQLLPVQNRGSIWTLHQME